MLTVSRSAVDFSGLGGIWDGPSHSGNVYCGQMNQYFRYFLGGMDAVCSGPRRKGSSRLLPATSPKARVCMVWGCVSALGKGNLHFCDGTINAESTWRFWSTICCLQEDIFSRDVHCIFQQDNANHILHTLQSPGCGGRGYGYLTGLPAVPTCLNRECVEHFEAQNATHEAPYCCPP